MLQGISQVLTQRGRLPLSVCDGFPILGISMPFPGGFGSGAGYVSG